MNEVGRSNRPFFRGWWGSSARGAHRTPQDERLSTEEEVERILSGDEETREDWRLDALWESLRIQIGAKSLQKLA